jgi:hypothetical protein
MVTRLSAELEAAPLAHEVVVLEGAGHDIFSDQLPTPQRVHSRAAWHQTLDFLEGLLEGPTRPPAARTY